MTKISILFIYLLLLCQNVENSSGDNNSNDTNDIINVYFSSFGNSSNGGNGTIVNPFNSDGICNFYNIFKNENSNVINETKIIVNFGAGQYNATNCTTSSIIGYGGVTIQSYKDNIQNNETIVLINGLEIQSIVSNITFLNLNLDSTISFSAEKNCIVTFNNSGLGLVELSQNLVSESTVIFIGSNLTFPIYGTVTIEDRGYFQFINESNLINTTLSYPDYVEPINQDESGLTIINSNVIGSEFVMYTTSFQFYNSNWMDTQLASSGRVLISNSILTMPYQRYITDLFTMFGISQSNVAINVIPNFKCIDSIVKFIPNLNQYSFLSATKSYISIENTTILNYQKADSLLLLSNSNVNIVKLHVENSQSSSLISVSDYSVIAIDQLKLVDNTFYSLINIVNSVSLSIESTFIKCQQNNNIYQMITMDTNQYINRINNSVVSISNFQSNCIGTYTMVNTNATFSNVDIKTDFDDMYISIYGNSNLTILNSKFISNSINQFDVLFSVDSSFKSTHKCTINLINSNFINSYSSILQVINGSSSYISNCTFENIVSYNYPLFQIDDSSLIIVDTLFNKIESALLFCSDSMISISNCTFSNLVTSIITSDGNSEITISGSTISQCATQTMLFSFSNDERIEINNSTFYKNHGYGYQLFSFFNTIQISIESCYFVGNSFSPLIQTNSTTISISNSHFINFTGSFLSSVQDDQLLVSDIIFLGNNIPIDYLFAISNTRIAKFINVLVSHYSPQFLYIVENVDLVLFDNFNFINNSMVLAGQPSSGNFSSIISFNQCKQIEFKGIKVIGNQISVTLFEFLYSIVTLDSSLIVGNQIQSKYNHFFSVTYSDFNILNSNITNNQGISNAIFHTTDSNLTIGNSYFNDNNDGSVLKFETNDKLNHFNITQSTFQNNTGNIGGVFSIEGCKNSFDICSLVTFVNNTFILNSAVEQGGVISTGDFVFSNNMIEVYNKNTFINNTSVYGNDFSSNLKNGQFNSLYLKVTNNVETIIKYSFLDYYGNVFMPISENVVFTIIRVSPFSIKTINNASVNAGRGQFYYTFIGNENDEYLLECTDPIQFKAVVSVDKCLQFQTFNSTTGICSYCQIGYAAINSTGSCFECNNEHLTCLGNLVSTLDNYYMIDQDISNVKQCTLDTCNSSNICTNELSTGLLCFYCLDPDENGIVDGSNGIITSKNGIQCCKYFNSFILISILVIVFMVFGLSLSWFKYNGYKSSFNSIILFIQINSIVFFSYNGIYILPLFRLSIDMIDGYCLFKSLNFNHKSILSFLIIISLFLIGSTDITLYLLKKLFGERIDIDQLTKPLLKDGYSNIKYPMFIQKAINIKEKSNRILSTWSLIQLFIIPLIFNSILSVVTKNINDTKYLSIDFSVNYGSPFNQFLTFISVISFIMVSILVLFNLLLNLNIIKLNTVPDNDSYIISQILKKVVPFLINCQKLVVQLNYKKSYKWWDIIIISRSIIYCTLSVTMLFSCQLYLAIIISIQLVYSISYFLLNPLKSIKHQLKDINNPINLLQLINFIILDSTLLHLSTPYEKGLTISILTFVSIIIILCYKHFYLNIRKIIKPRPTKPINNKLIN